MCPAGCHTVAPERDSDELKLSHGPSRENDCRASLLRLRNELCSVNGSYYAVAEVCEALKSVAAAERKFEEEHGHEVTYCVPWDVHAPGSLAETLDVFMLTLRLENADVSGLFARVAAPNPTFSERISNP
jgi:hypothetical protein